MKLERLLPQDVDRQTIEIIESALNEFERVDVLLEHSVRLQNVFFECHDEHFWKSEIPEMPSLYHGNISHMI